MAATSQLAEQASVSLHSPANNADSKKTKPRTSITPKQLEVLTQAYIEDQHPSKQVREELVASTGLEMKVSTLCAYGGVCFSMLCVLLLYLLYRSASNSFYSEF